MSTSMATHSPTNLVSRQVVFRMDISKPRDRIWYFMHKTERLSRYYSKRTRQLDIRFKLITLALTLIPALALALPQLPWSYPNWLIPTALVLVGLSEMAIIHFGVGGETKAAKIMANQTTELARQWRWLWIHQDRTDVERWSEMLESQLEAAVAEPIPLQKKLNEKSFEETENAFAVQFGG